MRGVGRVIIDVWFVSRAERYVGGGIRRVEWREELMDDSLQ
jgi:hypothetical protein